MKGIVIAILLAGAAYADDKKANVLLQAGQAKETVQGDLKAAIDLYGKAAKEAGANRALAAKALLHLGQCHERLGDAQARSAYERIVREYGDQREAGEAKTRLAAIGGGRVSNPSTLSVRQVTTISQRDGPYRLSPDGRSVAVTDWGNGDVAVVDLATGDRRLLTHEATGAEGADLSAWSPDGRQIVSGWWTKTNWVLKLSAVDGTGTKILHRCAADIRNMEPYAWSADSKRILVAINKKDRSMQIAWVSVPDGSLSVVKTIANNVDPRLSLSPDGRYIAYEVRKDTQKDIYITSSNGTSDSAVVEHPADDYLVDWAPDGRRLLFASDRTGATGLWSITVENGNPQGEPEVIRRDLGGGRITPFGLTRNGSLYYEMAARFVSDIFIATLDSASGKVVSSARPLKVIRTGANVLPSWSPDGKWLLYSFQPSTGGIRELWIADPDAGSNREVHVNFKYLGGPRAWFPDGRLILAYGETSNRKTGYYKVDVETGASATILPTGTVPFSTWSPGLKTYSSVKFGSNEIVLGNSETAAEKIIYKSPNRVYNQALSPDGRFVALGIRPAEGKVTIQVIPASGGSPRDVVHETAGGLWRGWGIAWSPDGKYIFYSMRTPESGDSRSLDDRHRYTLWRVPAAGGEAVNTGISMTDLRDINVNPDGRRVALSAGMLNGAETWVMENFLPR